MFFAGNGIRNSKQFPASLSFPLVRSSGRHNSIFRVITTFPPPVFISPQPVLIAGLHHKKALQRGAYTEIGSCRNITCLWRMRQQKKSETLSHRQLGIEDWSVSEQNDRVIIKQHAYKIGRQSRRNRWRFRSSAEEEKPIQKNLTEAFVTESVHQMSAVLTDIKTFSFFTDHFLGKMFRECFLQLCRDFFPCWNPARAKKHSLQQRFDSNQHNNVREGMNGKKFLVWIYAPKFTFLLVKYSRSPVSVRFPYY